MRPMLLSLLLLLAPTATLADDPVISDGFRFDERDGAQLYRGICQGCHMADGRGAQGAGEYPALAGNARLASGKYVVVTVLQGRRAMPAFGDALSDEQVAQVVNYVRTNLGNRHADAVTPADVKFNR